MNTNRPIWPERYIPSPRIPKWFADELRDFGGLNEYGAPVYRVIWAMDVRTFRSGNPRAIKYPNPNDTNLGYACFWLERYAGPDFFNEVHWNALRFGADERGTGGTVDYLGPFPGKGDYIGVAPLVKDNDEGEPWEMIKLSRGLLEELCRRLAPNKMGAEMSALGIVEAQRRLKKAKTEKIVEEKLEENREAYRKKVTSPARQYDFGLANLPASVREQAAALSVTAR